MDMVTLLGAGATLVAVAVFIVAIAASVRIFRGPSPDQGVSTGVARDPRVDDLLVQMERITLRVDELPSIWEREVKRAEEEYDRAKKQHAAARAAESRARAIEGEREDEHGTDRFTTGDLFEGDGRGGGESELPTVPEDLERASSEDLTQRALAAGWQPWL